MVYLLTFNEAINYIILGLLATAESIIKIGGAVAATIIFINKVWFKKWYAGYKAARNEFRVAVLERFDKVEAKVNTINKQVNPNGGSSLPDSNVRIEKVLGGLIQSIENIDSKISGIVLSQRNTREISGIHNWESDANGSVTYVAPSLCEIYGVTAEYVMGYSWVGLIIPRDKQRSLDAWHESIEYGTSYEIELTIQRSDKMYVDIKATAIHTKKDGKVVNSLGRVEVLRDAYKELI